MNEATAKRRVLAWAKRTGATVEYDRVGIHCEIRIEAPAGQVFKGDDVHEKVTATLGAYNWQSALLDCTDFEPCQTPHCEWCEETQP